MEKLRCVKFDHIPGAVIAHIVEPDLSGPGRHEILELELSHEVEQARPARLIVDFCAVKTITSSVISVLLRQRQRLLEQGGRLLLCHVPMPIHDVYRTLNLDRRILPIYPTVADALEAYSVEPDPQKEQMED